MNDIGDINIRSAVIDDVENLITLLVAAIRSACSKDYNQEQINAWASSAEKNKHWEKFINTQFFIVAEIDEKAVGFASLENGDYVHFMYVHQDYSGQGIASKLYKTLEQESKRLGCTTITANVSKTALSFFANKGFNVVKENKNLVNNVVIINYHMVRDVST